MLGVLLVRWVDTVRIDSSSVGVGACTYVMYCSVCIHAWRQVIVYSYLALIRRSDGLSAKQIRGAIVRENMCQEPGSRHCAAMSLKSSEDLKN